MYTTKLFGIDKLVNYILKWYNNITQAFSKIEPAHYNNTCGKTSL